MQVRKIYLHIVDFPILSFPVPYIFVPRTPEVGFTCSFFVSSVVFSRLPNLIVFYHTKFYLGNLCILLSHIT